MNEDFLTPESKDEYEKDRQKYFKNLESTKTPGLSADQAILADKHLPSKRAEQKILDRWEKGLSKTSRSGAFTNNPNASSAIFPNGLKFASDFIDENTPKGYEAPKEAKPPEKQIAPAGYFEQAAAVIENWCPYCFQPTDDKEYVGGIAIIEETDSAKCFSMGVKQGDTVLYTVCMPCFNEAKELTRDRSPLVLVFGGGLTSDEDLRIAAKYGFPMNMHEGSEKTAGQWELVKRRERFITNLHEYLRVEAAKPSSPVFRSKVVANE